MYIYITYYVYKYQQPNLSDLINHFITSLAFLRSSPNSCVLIIIISWTEVGIYKRKEESKKERKHAFD